MCHTCPTDLAAADALTRLDDGGGYMLANGFGQWMVIECIDRAFISGFRDVDAHGVNVATVAESVWAAAGWREDLLPGYTGPAAHD